MGKGNHSKTAHDEHEHEEDNRMFPGGKMYCEGRYKPLLRGYIHASAILLLVPAVVLYCARHVDEAVEQLSFIVLVIGSVICWGASASFHCIPWSLEREIQMQKLDHSAVFINIACSFTPIAYLVLHKSSDPYNPLVLGTMAVIWIACFFGIWHVHYRRGQRMKFWVTTICLSFVSYPYLSSSLTLLERSYAIYGLVLYSIGAVIFGRKTFNPIPNVFEHHEVFHFFTVLAGLCAYFLVHSLCKTVEARCFERQSADENWLASLLMKLLASTLSTEIDVCHQHTTTQ